MLTAVYTIHADREERRVSNLFELTKNHREIWSLLIERPELLRVLDAEADVDLRPITEAERRFVLFLVLHLSAAFEAQKRGMYIGERGLHRDISQFFNLPIPNVVWHDVARYQRTEFVAFVEDALAGLYS